MRCSKRDTNTCGTHDTWVHIRPPSVHFELCVQFQVESCRFVFCCDVQASISSSMKPDFMRLDMGQIEIDDLANNTSYLQFCDKCMKNRLPPLSPDKFEVKLRQEKQFTNGKEDFDHVVKDLQEVFRRYQRFSGKAPVEDSVKRAALHQPN